MLTIDNQHSKRKALGPLGTILGRVKERLLAKDFENARGSPDLEIRTLWAVRIKGLLLVHGEDRLRSSMRTRAMMPKGIAKGFWHGPSYGFRCFRAPLCWIVSKGNPFGPSSRI